MVHIVQRETESDIAVLVGELERGSRAALSQLLTLAAAGQSGESWSAALKTRPKGAAPVIALTGSGGVGKSSLLGAVTMYFVERDRKSVV